MNFEQQSDLFATDDEIGNWVQEIDGTIRFESHDDDRSTEVGTISGYRIRGGHSESIYRADEHSQEVLEYAASVFTTTTGDWRAAVTRRFKDATSGSDLLVVHVVHVAPAHRGRGVGLAATVRFLDLFSNGCGFALGRPFPLQFNGQYESAAALERLGVDRFAKDRSTAFKSLTSYWRRAGFAPLGRTGLMLMNLDYRRPSLRDLGLA